MQGTDRFDHLVSVRETHRVGDTTRERLVDGVRWPALAARHLTWAGTSDAGPGFEFATNGWRFGQVMVCYGGAGEAKVDGAWQACAEGTAYLTPPGQPHAYRALAGGRWQVCWLTYAPPLDDTPIGQVDRVTLVPVDPRPLRAAVVGLHRETVGAGEPAAVAAWAELVHLYALRVTGRAGEEQRLWRIWEAVDADLARDWTVDALADSLSLSGEHLRRLCRRQLGRSPMQQVAHMRMRRAAALLAGSAMKVDAVARSVGYKDRFGFSAAFNRVFGVSPGRYRKARGA